MALQFGLVQMITSILMKAFFGLSLVLLVFAGQLNCSVFEQSKRVKSGEDFTLYPDETALTEDKKLKISLKGVGRKISESGETEYAEFTTVFNGSKQTFIINERGAMEKIIGGYIIKLINAESFGNQHCVLKISWKAN